MFLRLSTLILCLALSVPAVFALPDDTFAAAAKDTDASGAESKEDGSKAVNRPVKDKWAVVVGVGKFKNPKLNLKYSKKDAVDVYDFLVKQGNFAPDHIVLLTDEKATRDNILSVIGDKWLPRVALPDDLVFLYFSSHGSPSSFDIGGVNYLLAHDTDPENLYVSGIAMQDIARIIRERVHTDRLILVLDACHSGSAKPGGKGIVRVGNVDVDQIVSGTGQLVISSSEPKQRSWESKRYEGSVFTKYLIDGLSAAGNKTTIGDAFDFMKDKVQEEVLRDRGVLQTPVMKTKWKGLDLVLAARPSKPRSGFEFVAPDKREATPAKTQQTFEVATKEKAVSKKTRYAVTIETGKRLLAGTDAKIYVVLYGKDGVSEKVWFDTKHDHTEAGSRDVFHVSAADVGELRKIRVGHNDGGPLPGWYLDRVIIENEDTGKVWKFKCNRWLATSHGDRKIERMLYAE